MKTLHDNINHLMLALIIGVAGLGVSAVQDMAKSVEQLNVKMGQVIETIRDHEMRIRDIEKDKIKR